jgi:hypothetical protein
MYDFNGNTNSPTEQLLTSIENEKRVQFLRPTSIAYKVHIDPTFKRPHKDNNMPYLPPTEIQRLNVNIHNNPHKDFLPIYTNPYYTPNETGWSNINFNDLWRN